MGLGIGLDLSSSLDLETVITEIRLMPKGLFLNFAYYLSEVFSGNTTEIWVRFPSYQHNS